MFAPTMRVVDGADPYKIKLKYSQQTKEKAIKKKTPKEDFALCGARQRLRAFDGAAF